MTRSLTREQVTEGHVPGTPAFFRFIIGLECGPQGAHLFVPTLSKTSDTFSTLSPAEPFRPATAGFMRGQHPVPRLFGRQACLIVGRTALGSTIRVLVVDDFEPWRRIACSTLQKHPGLQVISEVWEGLEAVQKAQEQ